MSLLLEIEYLSGVCFAALGPDSDHPDWPPQPDRVFSALVASWGARGAREDEAAALMWLEAQSTPLIEASEYGPRTAVTCFVPPNDPESGRSGNREVWPVFRRRQPRRFPAARPHRACMRLLWLEAAVDDLTFAALDRLAFDTAYVGHSSSLTRCRFRREAPADGGEWRGPERSVYAGRLAELRRSYETFLASGGRRGRPLPGAFVPHRVHEGPRLPQAFHSRWLVLEHVGGVMPDIRGSALVAKAIRDTMLAGYDRIGRSGDIPEVVSGHAADGTPSRSPHLAVVPLAFIGSRFSDGHVLGFALVPPSGSDILDDEVFRHALRAVAPMNEDRGRRVVRVQPKSGSQLPFQIDLSPTFEAPRGQRSLEPRRYASSSRVFASVTPIALDRHLKGRGDTWEAEVSTQVARACQNIGLPAPEAVIPHKHSAFEGAPSAWPSGRAPAWMRWQLPASLRTRQLVHAVVQFAEPIQGPLIIGAGRFIGLGLCRPLDAAREQ